MRTIIDAHKHSLLQLKGPAVRTGLLKAPKLESLVVEPQLLFILPLLQEIKGHDRRARSCGVIHPISPNGSPMPLAGKAIAISKRVARKKGLLAPVHGVSRSGPTQTGPAPHSTPSQ